MEEKITVEQIEKLANLSQLYFTDEEKQKFKTEVSGIVEMLDKCGRFNVASVPNQRRVKYSELREDEIGESLDINVTMEGVKSRIKDHFAVDKVVDL